MSRRVLIVDDETDIADLLGYNLEKAGYDTRVAGDGEAGLREISDFRPDLVVLDIMMPGLNGHQVLTRIRGNPTTAGLPVIFLTARNEEADEVAGLDRGADDFITKPFSVRILQARIERLLDRRTTAPAQNGDLIDVGPLRVDRGTHEASLQGAPLPLTVTEFRLLNSLIEAEGSVMSRSTLIEQAIGSGITITERTIDVHVTSIRKKLGPLAPILKTVRGVGYRIDHAAIGRVDQSATHRGAET